MVVKYGERILSAPTKQGFNLMAWVLPFVALALGGAVVGVVVKRWRRQSSAAPVATPENRAASSSADPYGARFEEEFRKFES